MSNHTAFTRGLAFCAALYCLVQALLGPDAYVEFVRTFWIDLPWPLFAVVLAVIGGSQLFSSRSTPSVTQQGSADDPSSYSDTELDDAIFSYQAAIAESLEQARHELDSLLHEQKRRRDTPFAACVAPETTVH